MLKDQLDDFVDPNIIMQNIGKNRKNDLSKKERQALQLLIKHYGDDWRTVTDEMNRTFFHRVYFPSFVKSIYEANHPKNQKGLSNKDANTVFKMISALIGTQGQHIWIKINNVVKQRSVVIMQRRFFQILMSMMQWFNHCYAPQEKQLIYNFRIKHFLFTTFYIIIYMGVMKPNYVEESDPILFEIWNSCQKMYNLFSFMFQHENFVNKGYQIFNFLPSLQKDEYMTILEPILLVDTINRISFGHRPYKREEFVEQNNLKPEDQISEVPQIVVQSRQRNVIFKKNERNAQLRIIENFFPRVSLHQRELISSSSVAQLLIPILSTVQQRWSLGPLM